MTKEIAVEVNVGVERGILRSLKSHCARRRSARMLLEMSKG